MISEGEQASTLSDSHNVPTARSIFKQVELSPLALQLHALCGDHMADAPNNLATLDAMRFPEFLFLIDEQGAFLTAAAHAYREGTPAYDRIMNAEDSPHTNLFALHVTDIWTESEPSGEPVRGPIIGDLVEVELPSQKINIHQNAVVPTIKDGERHFTDADFTAVRRHLEHISNAHQLLDGDMLTDPSRTFPRFNLSYMKEAVERSEHDVILIPNLVAKEMLMRDDVAVYLINESRMDTAALSQLDVVRLMKFGKDNSFAIKAEDLSGFNKWASRTAPEIVQQAQAKERGGQKKNHKTEL